MINTEGERESKNKNQTNLTSKDDEMKKTENGIFKATIKEVVKEEVKILSYESKMKIIALRTTLANIYSTHLSNVRRAGHHYDMILELGGDMTKEIRIFFAKYSKELNQYESENNDNHDSTENQNVDADNNKFNTNSTNKIAEIQENKIGENGTFQNIGSSSTAVFDANDNVTMKTMHSNNFNSNNTANNNNFQDIKTDSNDRNFNEASAVHMKTRERTTKSSPISTNSDTTSTALPGSTSFSTSSQPTRILERAGFSLNRWVVKSEKEKSNLENFEQEYEDDVAPRGRMKMSGMKGNEGRSEETLGDRGGGMSSGSGSGSGNVVEGESSFEALVRMNEEPDEDDDGNEYSSRGGGGSGGGQSSVLSAMSSNRRGRG